MVLLAVVPVKTRLGYDHTMPFKNPFNDTGFKWFGFPLMLIAFGLLAWSITGQTCSGYKIGLYKPSQVEKAKP